MEAAVEAAEAGPPRPADSSLLLPQEAAQSHHELMHLIEEGVAQNEMVEHGAGVDMPPSYSLALEGEEGEEEMSGVLIERGAGDLPPSYSLAEGLDQLPAYSQVKVNRARLGPYILIYDQTSAQFKSFKK
jgi:hypothetical protein